MASASEDTFTNETELMATWRRVALSGLSDGLDVTLNSCRLTSQLQAHTSAFQPLVGVDANNSRVFVSARWKGPLPVAITIARGLASDPVLAMLGDEVDSDSEDGPLSAIGIRRLQKTRCLGYLQGTVSDLEDYLEAIRRERVNLTRQAGGGDSRAESFRRAHGLASTMAHLLDLLDITPIREIRFRRYMRDVHTDGDGNRWRNELLKYLSNAIPKSSRLDGLSANRLLYEPREGRREQVPGRPQRRDEIPEGSHIGSWILTGNQIHRLTESIVDTLESPGELQTEAPYYRRFQVPVSIGTERRITAFEEAVDAFETILSVPVADNVDQTLAMLTQGVYPAAQVLWGRVNDSEITVESVVRGLGILQDDHIIPDGTETQADIIRALAVAERPLPRAELAERAEVSTQSIRNHEAALLDFDIVRKHDRRYILSLLAEGTPRFIEVDDFGELLSQGPSPAPNGAWPSAAAPIASANLLPAIDLDYYPSEHAPMVSAVSAWFRVFMFRYDQGELRQSASVEPAFGEAPLISSEGLDW